MITSSGAQLCVCIRQETRDFRELSICREKCKIKDYFRVCYIYAPSFTLQPGNQVLWKGATARFPIMP